MQGTIPELWGLFSKLVNLSMAFSPPLSRFWMIHEMQKLT